MKNTTLYLALILLFTFSSCNNDDSETAIIDDGTVGVERFLITTGIDLREGVNNNPVNSDLEPLEPIQAKSGEINFAGWNAYVMPNYVSERLFVTIKNPNPADITFSFEGNEVKIDEEFEIVELPWNSSKLLGYVPISDDKVEFELVFRNSIGSVINKTWSVNVED